MIRHRVASAIVGGVALVAALVLIAGPTAAQNAPSRPVDRSVYSYVVFGYERVEIKGANSQTDPGYVRGGNIGSNGIATGNDATVNICANGNLTMGEETQVVGDRVRFSRNCSFWDLFTNDIVGEGGGTTHSVTNPVGPFPIVAVPGFPSFGCSTADPSVTVRNGDPPTTLEPGNYNRVEFQNGTTVTLRAGVYQMCNFHTGQNVTVITENGTILNIVEQFDMNNGGEFGLDARCGTYINVAGTGIGHNDAAISYGRNTAAAGHFFSMGKINLGNSTQLYGTFWGSQIASDWDVQIEYCPPLGELVLTKDIVGSGAGQQGQIEFSITCRPNPPNTTPIPPWVIPAGATGVQSTVVTGITVPATCDVQETSTGDNESVDVVVHSPHPAAREALGAPVAAPVDVDLCPAFVSTGPLLRAAPPGLNFVNEVATTSTTSTTTTTTTTTTIAPTSTTSTTLEPTTTSTTSTTVDPGTTTTAPPTLPPPSTTIPCVLPPLPTVAPTIPATGGGQGTGGSLAVAIGATMLGVLLVLTARRRHTSHT